MLLMHDVLSFSSERKIIRFSGMILYNHYNTSGRDKQVVHRYFKPGKLMMLFKTSVLFIAQKIASASLTVKTLLLEISRVCGSLLLSLFGSNSVLFY